MSFPFAVLLKHLLLSYIFISALFLTWQLKKDWFAKLCTIFRKSRKGVFGLIAYQSIFRFDFFINLPAFYHECCDLIIGLLISPPVNGEPLLNNKLISHTTATLACLSHSSFFSHCRPYVRHAQFLPHSILHLWRHHYPFLLSDVSDTLAHAQPTRRCLSPRFLSEPPGRTSKLTVIYSMYKEAFPFIFRRKIGEEPKLG